MVSRLFRENQPRLERALRDYFHDFDRAKRKTGAVCLPNAVSETTGDAQHSSVQALAASGNFDNNPLSLALAVSLRCLSFEPLQELSLNIWCM